MSNTIDQAARAWLNRNGGDFQQWQGEEFIATCIKQGINCNVDDVTAYIAGGRLVFIVEAATHVRRAQETGLLIGIECRTIVREGDRSIIAVAKVHRHVKLPHSEPAIYEAHTYRHEVNVKQWADDLGKCNSIWKSRPESMAMKCAKVAALKDAFAGELIGLDHQYENTDAPTVSNHGAGGPNAAPRTPPPQAAPPKSRGAAAGRSAIQAFVDHARDTAAQHSASPSMALTSAASDHGYTPGDVESIAKRLFGVGTAQLSQTQAGRVVAGLGRKLATAAQWSELCGLRDAFTAGGGDFGALLKGQGYDAPLKIISQDEAAVLIGAVEPLVREAA